MKKIFLFSAIALLLSTMGGCEKNEKPQIKSEMKRGKIIGYVKGKEIKTKKELLGFVIAYDKNDSWKKENLILAFNMPSEIVSNFDQYNSKIYANYWNGDSIQFKYRKSQTYEQKKFEPIAEFAFFPSFGYMFSLKQVVITDVRKIE